MKFLDKIEKGVSKIVNTYEDRKEIKKYYGIVDNKKLYNDLMTKWNEAKKINFIIKVSYNCYYVEYV